MATSTLSESLGDLPKKVVKARDQGDKDWSEIADQFSTGTGKVMLAYLVGTVEPGERIKAKNESDLAKKIVSARDKQNLSWGVIAARADIPEGRVRRLYESVKGDGSTSGNRIGKGGRYPNGQAPKGTKTTTKKAAKTTKAKKVAAKKTPGKKTGTPARVPLDEMDQSQITARLAGKVIGVDQDGKTKSIKVQKVTGLTKVGGTLKFIDAKTGNERAIKVDDIVRASK